MAKKSREEIINSVLEFLDEKPLSIQQLSERVGSNWMTINEILEELKKEGKVKEVVATDKIKIIKRTDYPVFYGIPIKKECREQTLFIASEIVKEWRKKNNGEMPLNTTLQKVTVEIIEKCKLNLPVLPLHYGLVTALAIKPEEEINKDYEWKGNPEKSIILKTINEEIQKHKNNASEEEDKQYSKYGLKLFQTRKEIVGLFKQCDKMDIKKLDDSLLKFYFLLPTDNIDVYNLFDKFLSSCTILFISKEPKKNLGEIKIPADPEGRGIFNPATGNDGRGRASGYSTHLQEIRETFDILWDLITASMFLKDAKKFILPEDTSLFELIKSFHLNSKMCTAEERVSNLESIVKSINPDELDVPMDKESIEIRRIMAEGAEEG